jgi:translocation and assembly module TamB
VMYHGGGAPLFTGLGLMLTYDSAGDLFREGVENDGTQGVDTSAPKRTYELGLKIPTARVDDMAVFNNYLPSGSPFAFSSGTADLTADILLKPDDASGFLRLKADGMQAQIDEQSIRTDFSADISLVGGVPQDRLFDISGSEFRLDDVSVMGANENFDQKNWATVINLSQAELGFASPISLRTQADLHMTDSRPIVAMLGNQKDRPGWVKKMLTIEDVKGVVKLDMADNRILIPEAFIDSEKIDIGAKAVIKEGLSDGVIYARYRKLDFLVKYTHGKRNIDLIRARRKFDDYQLPVVID